MAPVRAGGGFHSSIRRAVLQSTALCPHVLPSCVSVLQTCVWPPLKGFGDWNFIKTSGDEV